MENENKTATKMLSEKPCIVIGLDAHYGFNTVINAMEEYASQFTTPSEVVDGSLEAFDNVGEVILNRIWEKFNSQLHEEDEPEIILSTNEQIDLIDFINKTILKQNQPKQAVVSDESIDEMVNSHFDYCRCTKEHIKSILIKARNLSPTVDKDSVSDAVEFAEWIEDKAVHRHSRNDFKFKDMIEWNNNDWLILWTTENKQFVKNTQELYLIFKSKND